MTAAPIHLAGERLMLDPSGALIWPGASLLAVSDLHLEKGSSYARHGQLLPPWDTHATLDRLSLLLRRYHPRVVIALGDSFHDADGSTRLPSGELSRVRSMTEAHRFVWVQGNHHPTAAIAARGGSVSRPCFVIDRHRLMMPAFGAYTGGLDVRDPAIARLFPRGGRVFLLGRERLFSFALGTLRSG